MCASELICSRARRCRDDAPAKIRSGCCHGGSCCSLCAAAGEEKERGGRRGGVAAEKNERRFKTFSLELLALAKCWGFFFFFFFFESSVSSSTGFFFSRGEFRRDMVEMLPHRRPNLAKNTFLGEKSGCSCVTSAASGRRERSGEKRRGIRFLRSMQHF